MTFREQSREIQNEFGIPEWAADPWYRHIGDAETIRSVLGINAPDGYLDLILRREWILQEIRDIRDGWYQQLKNWADDQTDEISFMDDEEVYEDYNRKRESVRFWMKKLDEEWLGANSRLEPVEQELVQIYRSYLDDYPTEFEYKKGEIKLLKRDFVYLRFNDELVAKVVDGSVSYARQFRHIPGEGIANSRTLKSQRRAARERDDNQCVRCEEKEDLVVHHIIPRDAGGSNEVENLATLCKECHHYAHGGGIPLEDGYETVARWSEVVYEDIEDFWKWADEEEPRRRDREAPLMRKVD